MENLFFLCISLSPTQEAKLMEVQRACFRLYHHPSSFALPPVLPVACHNSFEKAHQEWETNRLLNDWRPFVLSNLFRVGNILAAGPTPIFENRSTFLQDLSPDNLSSKSNNPQDPSILLRSFSPNPPCESDLWRLEAFPYLGGFYISALYPLSNVEPLTEFPQIPVRVVRLQVLRIASVDPRGRWWKGIEWTVEEEKWVRIKTD